MWKSKKKKGFVIDYLLLTIAYFFFSSVFTP